MTFIAKCSEGQRQLLKNMSVMANLETKVSKNCLKKMQCWKSKPNTHCFEQLVKGMRSSQKHPCHSCLSTGMWEGSGFRNPWSRVSGTRAFYLVAAWLQLISDFWGETKVSTIQSYDPAKQATLPCNMKKKCWCRNQFPLQHNPNLLQAGPVRTHSIQREEIMKKRATRDLYKDYKIWVEKKQQNVKDD